MSVQPLSWKKSCSHVTTGFSTGHDDALSGEKSFTRSILRLCSEGFPKLQQTEIVAENPTSYHRGRLQQAILFEERV